MSVGMSAFQLLNLLNVYRFVHNIYLHCFIIIYVLGVRIKFDFKCQGIYLVKSGELRTYFPPIAVYYSETMIHHFCWGSQKRTTDIEKQMWGAYIK
jgi:hypothetical protein